MWAGGEQSSRQRVSCPNTRSKSADRNCNSQLELLRYRQFFTDDLCGFYLEFFDIHVGTTCSRATRMRMKLNAHLSSYAPRKSHENVCTAQCFLLKGLLKHFMCFRGRFYQTETKYEADSLFGTVRHHDFARELDNTWEN